MRHRSQTLLFAATVFTGMVGLQTSSWAAEMVKVQLEDPSAGNGVDAMKMVAEPATVKAGKITFQATNESQGLIHEMIVIKAPEDGKPLPYDAQADKINEEGIHSLGEVSEREPGKAGTLTVDLKPGKYVLLCNQAGHYKSGMWTTVTATP